jgi:oligosaccharide repeat unit polymerase
MVTVTPVSKSARTEIPTAVLFFLIAAGVSAAAISLCVSIISAEPERGFVASVGTLSACVIFGGLAYRKRFDIFEPLSIIGISVFIGCCLRSIYIAISPRYTQNIVFLIGWMDYSDLAMYELIIPIALFSLVIGYTIVKKRVPIERMSLIRRTSWPKGRVAILCGVLITIGVFGTYILAIVTNVSFSDISTLSAKRSLDLSQAGGSEFSHAGYYRWMAKCLGAGAIIYFASLITNFTGKKRRRISLINKALVLCFLILASIWPVISSSRTGVMLPVFAMFIIYIYLSNRGNVYRFVKIGAICLVFALATLVGMGVWRQISQRGEIQSTDATQVFLDQTVGSGNFLPSARTAFIIKNFDDSYFLGATYLDWIFAPIPKVIWSGRPDHDLGVVVRSTIYKRRTFSNGYPPGMLGEAYLNFGYVGVIIIPFLFGSLMKIFYVSFKPLLGKNKNATVLYGCMLWPVAMQLGDLDFSSQVLNTVVAATPVLVFLRCMKIPARSASGRPGGVAMCGNTPIDATA